jgi:anti-sigma factor RsiW
MTGHNAFLLLAAKQIAEPLSPDKQRALDAHLSGCAPCRSIAAGMRRDDNTIRAALGEFGVSDRTRRRELAKALERAKELRRTDRLAG